MGQSSSKNVLPDSLQFQFAKHSKILSELSELTYEDFQKCVDELNELSRKCVDKNGNQLVFAVQKGSEIQWLWKATCKIACVYINATTRHISSIKMINLKQFLHVFNMMTTNLEAISAIEEKQQSASSSPNLCHTTILNELDDPKFNFDQTGEECCICLERTPDLILACCHSFCMVCLEQWSEVGKKSCPICSMKIKSIDDAWVTLEVPDANEINDEIVQQLQKLANNK